MSTDDPKSWPWLKYQLLTKGEAIATSLRSGVPADRPVPGLEWNVGRLGAHIVSVADLHRNNQEGQTDFPPVNEIPTFSDRWAADVGTTDPAEQAELLVPALQRLIDRLGPDGDAPAKFYQHDVTTIQAAGVVLSEMLTHHFDLVGATGQPAAVAKITNRQARAAFTGLFAVSHHLVNPEVARKCQGVIHIHLTGDDGGDHWTTTISGDTAINIPGKPPKADFHTRADPATLLLTTLGRASQNRALLTGKIIGYGKNPILGFRSQNLFYGV